MRTKDLAYIALFTALIAAGAYIRIPVPVVPFTLQFLFTNLAGLLLGAKKGAVSVGCYIALGLIGLPVFTGGGGIFYVFEPTFGYIIGFAAGAALTGYIAGRKQSPSFWRLMAASGAGLIIVYLFGMIYYWLICNFYLSSPIGVKALFLYCFALAVPGDAFLCFISAIIAKRVRVIVIKQKRNKKMSVEFLKNKVLSGGSIEREEAVLLIKADLNDLCCAANEIREKFCGNGFDLCAIVNAKSGRCGEGCKFCAQSARYSTCISEYPLISAQQMVCAARRSADCGVLRFSAVTSGGRLCAGEIDSLCESLSAVKRETDLSLCASVGLVSVEDFIKLKAAGVERIHCNLETSRSFFPKVCTTHTYSDKIAVLKAALAAGLNVCSGGIMGLGEDWDDRIDLGLELRDLGVKSVPLNFLNPVKGTPFENNKPVSENDKRRITAIFRFILPDASIRLAGGRKLMPDNGAACFCSGANAAITGDMLTTSGVEANEDYIMLRELGYEVKRDDE